MNQDCLLILCDVVQMFSKNEGMSSIILEGVLEIVKQINEVSRGFSIGGSFAK